MTDSRKDVAFHSSDRMIYAQERKNLTKERQRRLVIHLTQRSCKYEL
jgi:hypothetical protein